MLKIVRLLIITIVLFTIKIDIPSEAQEMPPDTIRSITWSPDGTQVATGHVDGSIKIWDAATLSIQFTLTGHTEYVLTLAWSPNGELLASNGFDDTLRIWDLETQTTLQTFQTEPDEASVQGLTWHSNSQIIFGGTGIGLRSWNSDTGNRGSFHDGIGSIGELVWNPSQTAVAAAGIGLIYILDPINLDVTTVLQQPDRADGTYVDWHPIDSNRVASGSRNGYVRIWDIQSEQIIHELLGSDSTEIGYYTTLIKDLAFSPDGNHLSSLAADGTLRTWDTSTGEVLDTTYLSASILAAEWSPDGTQIAYGGSDGLLKIIDTPLLDNAAQEFSPDAIRSITWSPDGTQVATAHFDSSIKVWDAATLSIQFMLTGHTDYALALAWSPNGELLASSGFDATLRIWDLETQSSIQIIPTGVEEAGVQGLAWSSNSQEVLGSTGMGLQRWDANTGNQLDFYSIGSVSKLIWGPTNAAIGGVGRVLILDPIDLDVNFTLQQFDTATVTKVNWHPFDNNQIASASRNGHVLIWDIQSGQIVHDLLGSDATELGYYTTLIKDLAFSPDGNHLSSLAADGTLRTWDTSTGEVLDTTYLSSAPIFAAEWSPDGTQLAYGGSDGLLYIIASPQPPS